MNFFDHDTFLSKLKDLDIDVKIVSLPNAHSNFHLEVNNIPVKPSEYNFFGYQCFGTYNQCSRNLKTDFNEEDVNVAIKKAISILQDEIQVHKFTPNYHSCKDFLNENFGKTQVEKNAIVRVFSLIKENYNDIIKYMKQKS